MSAKVYELANSKEENLLNMEAILNFDFLLLTSSKSYILKLSK